MAIAAIASLLSTKPAIYERNEFTYGPIKEVAILFVGIFSTMVPALNYLNHHSGDMPLKTPGQYYFITGALSSALDNAPTYLVFLETKQGQRVTVLLVMPAGVQRKLVGAKLSSIGFDVSFINSPLQAIEVAFSVTPHAILSSQELPGFSGSELAAVFKAIKTMSRIPSLFMSPEAAACSPLPPGSQNVAGPKFPDPSFRRTDALPDTKLALTMSTSPSPSASSTAIPAGRVPTGTCC